MEEYIAKASLVNAAQFNWLPLNRPLVKVIGWLILKTFPSFFGSGYFKMGDVIKVSFNISKDA